jgi:Tol biopolymer transport system component
MKLERIIFFVLIFFSINASAQLMNVRKWRLSERDSLDKGMELFDEKMYLRALPVFESLLSHHPKEEFLKYTYAKCSLYRSDKHEDSYKYFIDVYSNNKKVPDIQYDMALAALYNYKFDEATEYIDQYAGSRHTNMDGKKNAEILKRNIAYAKYYLANPTNAKVTNLGSAINSESDEYVPAITADESALIFTYVGPKSIGGLQNENLMPDKYGNYMEDIYMSYKEGGEFKPAFSLDSLNTKAPDAAISMSNDGTILFIYQDIGDGHGDIYQSFLSGDHFTKPQKLKGEVNSYSWDGHCSLSPDGQTLYFSSERLGGFGGRDLYKATLLPDSTWGNAVNLGDSINTPYDDDAPFIHADGVTLFYSSKGRTSMGGYDIFKSVMKPDSTFKKTENLGYPINSTADDIYFVMAANGNNGYYSSGKKDGKGMKDIYKVEPNFAGPKSALYLVKGKVKSNGAGIESTIKVEITSKNNKLYKTVRSNASTGSYLVTLPPGVSYQLTYAYKNLPEQRLNIDAVDLNGYAEKINNVDFTMKADTMVLAGSPKLPTSATPGLAAAKNNSVALTSTLAATKNTTTAAETQTLAAAKKAEATPTVALASAENRPGNKAGKEIPLEEGEEVINHVKQEPAKTETEAVAAVPEKTVIPVKKEAPAKATPTVALASAEKKETPKAKPVEKVSAENQPTGKAGKESPVETLSLEIKKPLAAENKTVAAWDFTTSPVSSTPLKLPASAVPMGSFVPVNGPQIKAVKFTEKYGGVSADDMEFRVQVAAVKNDKNVTLPNQKMLGKVEKLTLGDGFTRITVGGSFKTLAEALEHNKKVVKAGQKEGFIIALYKGKRVSYEELEKMGLLK